MRVLAVGLSTRALVEVIASSSERPERIISLDFFGDRDLEILADECYSLVRDFGAESFSVQEVSRACRELDFQALVYASGLENHPDWLAELAGDVEIWGNNSTVLQRARDWQFVHNALFRAGVVYPRTYYRYLGPTLPGKWLRKPCSSGGGIGIAYSQVGEYVPAGHLLQEYCPGIPASAGFMADGRRGLLLGVSEQLCGWSPLGAPGFLYAGNVVPLYAPVWDKGCPPSFWDQVDTMVQSLVQGCGLRGWNGVDFILTPEGRVVFLELNPRFPGSLELLNCFRSWDLFALHRQALAGQLPQAMGVLPVGAGEKGFRAKGIVYAPEDMAAPDLGEWEDKGWRDVPRPGEEIPAGNPVCTVYARGRSRQECLEALQRQRQEVLARTGAGAGGGGQLGRG